MEKPFESKENLSTIVIEIGSGHSNYIEQYKKDLPPNTIYKALDINYSVLPNSEVQDKRIIPLSDNSVNEIVLSNVLSDMASTKSVRLNDEREFEKQIVNSRRDVFNNKEYEWAYVQSEIAYYQKMRTVEDAIRVLKPGGYLTIYENYRQFHPDAVYKVLAWLKNNSQLEFTEDIDEESRVQIIFDEEFEKRVVKAKNIDPNSDADNVYNPRLFNKVYKIRKK